MAQTMSVPKEYVQEITKLFPKEPRVGLERVLRRGLTRIRVENKMKSQSRAAGRKKRKR